MTTQIPITNFFYFRYFKIFHCSLRLCIKQSYLKKINQHETQSTLIFFPEQTLNFKMLHRLPGQHVVSNLYHSFTPFSVAACDRGLGFQKLASKFLVMLASSLGRRLMFA